MQHGFPVGIGPHVPKKMVTSRAKSRAAFTENATLNRSYAAVFSDHLGAPCLLYDLKHFFV